MPTLKQLLSCEVGLDPVTKRGQEFRGSYIVNGNTGNYLRHDGTFQLGAASDDCWWDTNLEAQAFLADQISKAKSEPTNTETK